jgi:long-chain acyl-CoA synthetase
MPDLLDDVLRLNATIRPDHPAICTNQGRVSYAHFERFAAALADGFRRSGVCTGDRIAMALPNSAEAAIAIYGILRAGAVLVPLNPSIKTEKLSRVLADCEATVLVCGSAMLTTAREASRKVPNLRVVVAEGPTDFTYGTTVPSSLLTHGADQGGHVTEVDLAAIIYTSGSTGAPKGVMLTHRNMTFAVSSIASYLELNEDDRIISVLPLSFDYGLYQIFLAVSVGATLFLEPGIRYPGTLMSLMTQHRVTGLPGVPTLFQGLLGLPGVGDHRWPDLRFVTSTGAILPRSTSSALRRVFPHARLYSMYGLTECKRATFLPPDELEKRPDSVGIPIPGTEAWVENARGLRCKPEEIGELMVRGPHVMQGYWNDPAGTASRLRPGRWAWERTLATGDLFRCDDEGFLYFVGRKDEIIKSRGMKVAPREIEDVLLSAPGVLEAAVVGVDDAILGQAVYAHVTPQEGQTLEERLLRRHCAERLEDYLVPKKIIVHKLLPRTANGKVDRRALAQRPG